MRVPGVLSLIVLFSSVGSAQTTSVSIQAQPGQVVPGQPATPQRMPARPLRPGETPPKGSGVIKGQVIASGSGTPVRRAQVRVMTMDGRGGGGVTSTDNNGSYEVRDLPAGRYIVSASKGGFVTASFGQRRPNEQGTPIELAEGQAAEKVNFTLLRGGVISGRIVDDSGEPVSGIQVIATRYQFMGGTRRLVPGGMEGAADRTDDQGSFRLFGLPPGEYFVSANDRNSLMGGSTMVGLSNTTADGFAPTFFPGTPNLGEATRIPLKAGQEMSGANFALIVARMARIRGRVLNSRGEHVSRSMLMLASTDPSIGMFMNAAMNTMVGPDGTFELTNVAPGRYNLQVRPMSVPGDNAEFALVPLNVGSDDIDNLMITTMAGAIAKGVILTDDGSAPTFRHDVVQLFAQPMDPSNLSMMGGGPPRINEDYTFELASLFDRRLLRGSVGAMGAAGQNLGWLLKAVLYDGQDITDSGMEFAPGRVYEGLQVIFTRKATDLSGLVTDDRNRPIVDATVVVFPANRERWTFQSRFIRTSRPDTNGRYNFRNLPPADDYLIIAVQNLEAGQASDPDFLNRARDEATPLTLNENETKTVDVRLSPLVP